MCGEREWVSVCWVGQVGSGADGQRGGAVTLVVALDSTSQEVQDPDWVGPHTRWVLGSPAVALRGW